MAGYLEGYGAGDEQKERRRKRVVLVALAAIAVSSILYFTFRTWQQERAVKQFLAALQAKEYQAAYRLWGCTDSSPCRYYPPEKFLEDWGPQSVHADPSQWKVDLVEPCGGGVFFRLKYPKTEPVGLVVEKSTNNIGFAPSDWQECPGRHWRFKDFFRRVFG
jgi:hypothetical protein